ncbi:hypothetical protein [Clostridium cochlearium]|uniref:type IV pilus modification PilV family protein n=1 Tax=Clostridium cochlearium TaxID=1494 RepID=UPI001EDD7161|nr:hypothetical protein [Clostridium cochlearium]MBV1819075.1 hypothetical protein [Bacteroidales bacterium MSK.15.36]MCG4571910.1 hypothetical protein [Clostridium cochlearium]MCG4580654.1 hypothetical protein [Clostridium cochlearium]
MFKKKGLTLIEVLISMCILVIIVPPIISMVLTGVKTNKKAEDNQRALYIAQQCVEKIKSMPDIDNIETEIEKDNFKITQTATPEEGYYFPDKKNDNKEKENFRAIEYDGKIKVKTHNNIDGIYLYKGNDEENEIGSVNLKNNGNTINIINEAKENGNVDESKITLEINEESFQIENAKKDSNIIIEFNSIENTVDGKEPKIEIHTINNFPNGSLNIYLVKEKSTNVKYSFSNDLGKVKVYSNIFKYKEGEDPKGYSRLYKINVKVWRKEQDKSKDKPIQDIWAYKTALE